MPPDYDQFYHYHGDGDGLRYPREYRMKWTVKWHAWPRSIQGCEETTDFQNVLRHYDPFQQGGNPETVRAKLAEILWWGHQGNERGYVDKFLNARQAADQRLVQIHERMADAAPEFDNFNAITNFCNGFFDLKIPQFRYMAFGSKLFMFAAPCRLVVLDDKIYGRLKGFAARDNGVGRLAEILAVPIAVREHAITLLNAFVHLPQKMRGVTQSLIQAYAYWCLFCQAVAAHWQQHDKRWKASDVERWYFSRDPEE